MLDLTLYFVTPPIPDNLDYWEHLIKEAVLGGVTVVQIRDKSCSTRKMIKAARRVHPFLKERGIPLLVNDRADIAYVLALDGVHLGQSDLSVAEARMILGTKAIIGISLETREQIKTIVGADYIAASPVLPSKTKATLSSWGLEGLKALRKEISVPLIAIGGIRESNLPDILALGVNGVAVISAIASSSNPRAAAAHLNAICQRLKQ
jgi:thiamine-phosphate pyrophosphorylase